MKKHLKYTFNLLALILWANLLQAQIPQKMGFQAIIRDAANTLIVNQPVTMRISILQGSVSGTSVYTETHTTTTNINGLVTLEIGAGTPLSGVFASINWANGPYYIKTETDPNGGTNYSITSTSQLLSVPYAFHAKTADSLLGNIPSKINITGNPSVNLGNINTLNFPNAEITNPQLGVAQIINYPQIQAVIKSVDESKTNDTTFTNDSELTFNLLPNSDYIFEFNIIVDVKGTHPIPSPSSVISNSGGYRYSINFDGTYNSMVWLGTNKVKFHRGISHQGRLVGLDGASTATSPGEIFFQQISPTNVEGVFPDFSHTKIFGMIKVGNNGGNLSFAWAQLIITPRVLTITNKSYAILTKVK